MTAGGPVRYSISPRTSAAARRRRERERKARRIRRIAFSFTGLTLLTVAIVIVVMAATQNTSHAEVTQTPAPPAASQQQELRALVSTHEASGPEFAADIIVGHKEAPEAEPTEEPEPAAYFQITDAERDTIERVVMAEAGGEPFAGQEAVAQCILNACTRDNIRPDEAVKKYGYTRSRPDPTESVREAVAAVFDSGAKVTTAPILFFYAPARCTSAWHESQQFEIEINGHRFFSEKGD